MFFILAVKAWKIYQIIGIRHDRFEALSLAFFIIILFSRPRLEYSYLWTDLKLKFSYDRDCYFIEKSIKALLFHLDHTFYYTLQIFNKQKHILKKISA